jgi:hypothetical protein
MSARTTAKLPFWKMHGAGNDFVVAEAPPDLDEEAASRLAVLVCDRHTGVGADGLILVRPSTVADRRMQIVNADGSDGVMCVNGIRCFVRYCLDGRLVEETDGRVAVETGVGIVHCIASRDEAGTVVSVEVNIDPPVLDPAAVGVSIEQPAPVTDLPLTVRDDFGQTDAGRATGRAASALRAPDKLRGRAAPRSRASGDAGLGAWRGRDTGVRIGRLRGRGRRETPRPGRRTRRCGVARWDPEHHMAGRG